MQKQYSERDIIYFYSIIAVFSWHFILCGQIKDYFVLFSKAFI